MASNKNWASWMKSKIASERQQDDKTAQSTALDLSLYLNCSLRTGRGEGRISIAMGMTEYKNEREKRGKECKRGSE